MTTATPETTPCPVCSVTGSLSVALRLTPKPFGSFSLAGVGTKVTATEVPVLACAACGMTRDGWVDGRGVLIVPATHDRWSVDATDRHGIPVGETALVTHPPESCTGRPCVVHHPSDHHMREWPTLYRADRGITERACPHGVGHPDPDDLAYRQTLPCKTFSVGVHGCDGCCTPPELRPYERSIPDMTGLSAAPELGPIGDDMLPTRAAVHELHNRLCLPGAHDPLCNTFRLTVLTVRLLQVAL